MTGGGLDGLRQCPLPAHRGKVEGERERHLLHASFQPAKGEIVIPKKCRTVLEKLYRLRITQLADDVLVGKHSIESFCLFNGKGFFPIDAYNVLRA